MFDSERYSEEVSFASSKLERTEQKIKTAIVLCNHGGISNQILNNLRINGISVHFIGGPDAYLFKLSRYVSSTTILSQRIEETDGAVLAKVVNDCASRVGADVVLSSDFDVELALASVRPMLQVQTFPMSDPSVLGTYHDKGTFMELARRSDCPVPDFVRVETKGDLCHEKLSCRLGLPYVVKPSGEGNSNGVVYVDKLETLEKAIKRNEYYNYRNLIASAYVEGEDVGVSLFAMNGAIIAAVCQRRRGASIEFFENNTLIACCARMVKCGNFTGVAHFDARINYAREFQFIECNPRFWSTVFATAIAGMDFVALGLSFLSGNQVAQPRNTATRWVTPPNHMLLRWFGRRTNSLSTNYDSLRWLRVVAMDPVLWIATDASFLRNKLRSRRRSTRLSVKRSL